jgi:DNA-directed RNA polymerase subunit L
VDDEAALPISAADAAVMGVVDAASIDVHDPFDTLPSDLARQMVFIIKVGEKHYLVNTEGYDYCRYIMPCVVADNTKLKMVTVSITVAVQEGTRPEKWIAEAVQENLEAGEELVAICTVLDGMVDSKKG